MDGTVTLRQALELIRNGNSEKARTLLVELLRVEPENATAWFLLSHALDDPKRQEYALLQALKADPGFEKAQARLQKLRGKAAPSAPEASETKAQDARELAAAPEEDTEEEEAPSYSEFEQNQPAEASLRQALEGWTPEEASVGEPTEKRKVNWARVLIAVLAVPLLAALLVYGWQFVEASVPGSEPSLTPVASRTLAPTWTPTVAATAMATAEPSPIAQVDAPSDEIDAQLQTIRQQVVALRGLDPGEGVQNALVAQDQAVSLMVGSFLAAEQAEALSDQEGVLKTLGLLGADDIVLDLALNLQADPLGGFYDPAKQTIYLVGEDLSGALPTGYARLVNRAALGNSFDGLDALATCSVVSDRCVALRAVVLGDGALAGEQWLAANGNEEMAQAVAEADESLVQVQGGVDFVAPDLSFPYEEGLDFVRAFYDLGGWEAVDALYSKLPASSEQIMHPEKYAADEAPVAVADPSAIDVLGSGWRSAGKDSLGEWLTYLALAHGAQADSRLSADAAITAAAGWGGDQYQAYWRETDQMMALAAHWVMDSPADGAELQTALQQVLSKRLVQDASPIGSGRCWADQGQRACLFRKDSEVLWLQGPDEIVVLQVLLAQYPQFQ